MKFGPRLPDEALREVLQGIKDGAKAAQAMSRGESGPALSRQAAEGRRAADRLLTSVGAFLVHRSRRWLRTNPSLDLDDVMGAAVVGMMMAAERFDPDRGVGFLTFAAHHIDQHIRLCLMVEQSSLGAPRNFKQRLLSGSWSDGFLGTLTPEDRLNEIAESSDYVGDGSCLGAYPAGTTEIL